MVGTKQKKKLETKKQKQKQKPRVTAKASREKKQKKKPTASPVVQAKLVNRAVEHQDPGKARSSWKSLLGSGRLSKKTIALTVMGTLMTLMKNKRARDAILTAFAHYVPQSTDLLGYLQIITDVADDYVHGRTHQGFSVEGTVGDIVGHEVRLRAGVPANVLINKKAGEAADATAKAVVGYIGEGVGHIVKLFRTSPGVASDLLMEAGSTLAEYSHDTALARMLDLKIGQTELANKLSTYNEWNPPNRMVAHLLSDEQRQRTLTFWVMKLAEAKSRLTGATSDADITLFQRFAAVADSKVAILESASS